MTYWIVWNEAKTEGFATTDEQLAYEVRKGATSNCFTDGDRSDVGIAFADRWVDDNCTIEQVGPDPALLAHAPVDQASIKRQMDKLHKNSVFGCGVLPRDLPKSCPECGSLDCNGECMGDGWMGG